MFYPSGLKQYITDRMRQMDYSALCGQFSGLVLLGLSNGQAPSLNQTGQVASGNFYSYAVDVDNTQLVPTSGTTGLSFKCYFLPGRIMQNIGDTNNSISLSGWQTLGADYFLFPMPEFWYPANYPKGNVQDTPSGQWTSYEWNPFNNGQQLYYLQNNTQYVSPTGAYLFREERVILIKLGYTAQNSATNFNFVYNNSLMTYSNNPNRPRSGGLDKNTVITHIKKFSNRVLNQTLIT